MRVEILLAALAAAVAHAQYDTFFFSTNATEWECPGFPFGCPPPSACSHDATVNKYYCCIPGSTSNVCWTGSTSCSGANSTTAGNGQLDCGSYCCLSNREECTQREGQFNICWATQTNPLGNVSDARMNSTYSSLAAARPSATHLTFAIAAVTGTATTGSSSPSSSTSATATSSSTSVPSSKSDSGSSGLSGGAIAGIVVGVIAGILLIVGAFFFIRRTSRSRTATPSQEPYRRSNGGAPGAELGASTTSPVAGVAATPQDPYYTDKTRYGGPPFHQTASQHYQGNGAVPAAELDGGPRPGVNEYYNELEHKAAARQAGYPPMQELPTDGRN